MASSWTVEVDKFLRGEPNHLKDHPEYLDYDFAYKDKSFPTPEKVSEMFSKPLA